MYRYIVEHESFHKFFATIPRQRAGYLLVIDVFEISGSATRSFIIQPLRVMPLTDTYWTIPVAIWCLTSYPLVVVAFQIKLNYRLVAL